MSLLFGFLAGMFLINGIPHLVKGITGQTHLTPFGKVSSAKVNVVWAFVNFLLAAWVLNASSRTISGVLSFDSYSLSFFAGALVMALADAWLFSKPNAKLPWQ